MKLLESLEWRSAIKKFDPSKKVRPEDLEAILKAGNLAPTSGGIQPFKVIVVSNDNLKKKLVAASFGQSQVADASHLLVIAVETNINGKTVDRYVERVAEIRGQEVESLKGYADSIKQFVNSMDEESKFMWGRYQAYIALGFMLATAASLKVDSCPMEGLMPLQYQEMLDLKSKNLMPVVMLPIGYRSEEDVYSNAKKTRKKQEDFIIEVN